MREIPPLKTLALRAVGPPGCNPEVTFGGSSIDNSNNNIMDTKEEDDDGESGASDKQSSPKPPTHAKIIITPTSRLLRSMRNLTTQTPRPYNGPGRPNAADVDIAHPWIMAVHHHSQVIVLDGEATKTTTPAAERGDGEGKTSSSEAAAVVVGVGGDEFLSIENGNLAIETLQLFIDALVESGRAGDGKLGVHFFKEWVVAATGREDVDGVVQEQVVASRDSNTGNGGSRPKKRQKANAAAVNDNDDNNRRNSNPSSWASSPPPLGALSLHNFSSGSTQTFRSMMQANVGYCLGALDITGVHGLTDSILSDIICGGSFPHLKRLSVKNCRKLTGRGLASLIHLTKLTALDVGGCFNIHPVDVISMVRNHPSTKAGSFEELYASGLGWTDAGLEELIDLTVGQIRGLGIGFSPYLSGPGLLLTLGKLANTLDHLAVPFVLGMDDACLSALGKSLRKLAVLDIRGCNKVYSLSGMMEGRAVAGGASSTDDGHLFVLARYSGISPNSLDETLRLYDCKANLTCILDGGGTGGGIRR